MRYQCFINHVLWSCGDGCCSESWYEVSVNDNMWGVTLLDTYYDGQRIPDYTQACIVLLDYLIEHNIVDFDVLEVSEER